MKCFKVYIPVEDLVDLLTDEDKVKVKCSYISEANFDNYNGNGVGITVIVDEDDNTDELYDITENWFNEDNLTDEYMNYLSDNRLFEDEEKDNG